MRRIAVLLLLIVAMTTSAASFAASNAKPTVKKMMEPAAALGGHCPVAYVAVNKAIKGDPRFAVKRDGHRYLFVSADAKKLFEKNPERYTVAYDSWCATAVAFGKKVPSDPTQFTLARGVTYLFSNAEAKSTFDADVAGFIQKADANYPKLK